jgi:hypothetical protein
MRTDKDIYFREFSKLERGAPLFEPGEVQVGDVGYIDAKDGFFEKLYNIANPPTTYLNGERVGPPEVKFETVSHSEKWGIIYVCYLSSFILRT